MKIRISPKELYDLVWSEPVKNLAAKEGISDVAFAKVCRKHDVPLPPRGYWAKLQAGKKVSKDRLPPRGLGMPEFVQFGGNRWSLAESELPPPPRFEEPIDALLSRISILVGSVTVPKTFSKAHRIVGRLLEQDDVRRQKYLEERRLEMVQWPVACCTGSSPGTCPQDTSIRSRALMT